MKILNLLVGGPIDLWPDELKNGQIKGDWIGIDRGNLHLIERGIDPLVAIGDFDSLKPAELQLVRDHIKDIRQSIPEKDDTDTQLGLKVALQEHHADRLDIYGATGGRLDHFLANLWMVLEPRFKPYAPKIRMIDKQNTITFFLPGTYQIEKEPDKKYLAFVALTPMDHLTLFDEKYQLNDYQVKHPMSLASNEFVGETARFKFGSGVMCVIQSKDINRYN
ncbi:thiamine diphosphokinase [Lentilactobacillus buchneri]|uniref:Thiamine diphosphokinase n=1 Tax=Lentilactobacillus buchneri DSM 20057 TaxID=1423728 RepID=A0A4R5NKW6_LENBU|nr:thiamine diphosphokinase [Lentilactobacillus buchneri]MCC6100235.1 thiamine diphosphokinase [Lactobacillus sp.]AEB73388.1 thiamine pyrophosphokinase [Lentilactobacillus buchneri NRRL B-30929]KRK69826.1 thiamine pyrophosphokinase [Lentilactobacillus buchneri DSM 20057]MCT2881766.1 thiamine diphosphokinase [Lentilactobacillus buchneri]MCT2899482.1 thiamine diphosphokinase [Lentilactobacillus buchneri]